MNPQYRATLVAAASWIGLHLALGLITISASRSLWLTFTAMALAAAASLVAVRPLLAPYWVRPLPAERWLLLLAIPLIQFLDLAALEPRSVTGYGNWASGGLCVLIAALVMRGETRLGILGTLLLMASGILGYRIFGPPLPFVDYLLLTVPAQTWLAASLGVRHLLKKAEELTASFDLRTAEATSATNRVDAWAAVRAARERDLESTVLPFAAEVIAAPDAALAHWQERAASLSLAIRDALRTHDLIDNELAKVIAAARSRGVSVQLSGSGRQEGTATHHESVLPTRELLTQLLTLSDLTAISLHSSQQPPAITLSLGLPGAEDAGAIAAVRSLFPDWRCATSRVDGELLISCIADQ